MAAKRVCNFGMRYTSLYMTYMTLPRGQFHNRCKHPCKSAPNVENFLEDDLNQDPTPVILFLPELALKLKRIAFFSARKDVDCPVCRTICSIQDEFHLLL